MAKLFELPRYIAVEGPIRVGKSTLALSQNPRQRALPNSYRTFNRNVTGKLEKLGHDYRM